MGVPEKKPHFNPFPCLAFAARDLSYVLHGFSRKKIFSNSTLNPILCLAFAAREVFKASIHNNHLLAGHILQPVTV